MPIRTPMRRSLAITLTTVAALAALAASALAATPRPVVTSFSPAQPTVGSVLVLNGKNFSKVAKNNRVYFRRASDGKTVRARARKATKRRLEVVIPATLSQFLTVDSSGNKQPTRFQIGIFTTVFGPFTKKTRSPLIGPAGSVPGQPGAPGTTPATPAPPQPDCNKNGIPDAQDSSDSDGDGLPDSFEVSLKLDP